jgi:steroid delta-isomerase-like uncharacterized protein
MSTMTQPSPSSPSSGPGVTVLDPAFTQEWGTRWGDVWNSHDPDAVVAMCTEDVHWYDPALPAPIAGRAAVRDFAAATFAAFPDFHVEDREDALYLSGVEPLALCPYRMTGTMLGEFDTDAATKASFSVPAIDQWTLRGDQICRYVTYYDHAEMGRQLGMGAS